MKGTIIKIKKDNFKDGKGYWVFCKMEDGKSARAYLIESFGNFKNWQPYLRVGQVLEGLVWKNEKERIIDADSPLSPFIDQFLAKMGVYG